MERVRKFESDVQLIKYEVLREVAKLAMEGTLEEKKDDIQYVIDPGPEPRTRCCIYKEREITKERVKLAMGGDKDIKGIVEVLEVACDKCPLNRFFVTEACRGCLAHRCSEACPRGAIHHINGRAYIDQEKCIECGRCKEACPYNAIADVMRPCRRACPAGAISFDDSKKAVINYEKCIQCGACIIQCPFGAIMDKSFIVDVIELLKETKKNDDIHVYAAIAPAISSQFTYAKIEQVVCGIKKLGFHDVVEVALGADMVGLHEAKEFAETVEEKGIVTTSCCPAFVSYIKKNYPELEDKISNTVSPMIAISRLIKHIDPKAKIVFIGPCVAKKGEIMEEELKGDTDYVLTFEELAAMLDAAEIDLENCNDGELNNASYYGRIFARSGGVTEAVAHTIESKGIDTDFRPVKCDGIKECDKALKMAKVNRLNGNFIEGMACVGGCIAGPASLHHGPKDKNEVDKYGKLAIEEDINSSLRIFEVQDINLDRK
ncbi:4Fe-4S dicluster domain-containing protein [Sporanaerobacter acetigenes]|uniref:[FeFe] hydrogenase, group B1/B3 n=1 Tax=Sporanaerobacter acetigenes DSM 13106 TaxID=1123281 RepID=A0A1M5Z577_9FIRM|nr:4Fe-4S dicluster domain-containing protein [Sporanaerobacter acetigenes]SHI19033.1 [FeFe] hydrogenase, group B1/B3 [Sporanaerobacter acetigenes DSM 13106]